MTVVVMMVVTKLHWGELFTQVCRSSMCCATIQTGLGLALLYDFEMTMNWVLDEHIAVPCYAKLHLG